MSIEKDDSGTGNPATWIDDCEKYALVGLSAKVEEYIQFKEITSGLWVLVDTTFNIPPHWRDWLGSIRADEVQNSNLFLLSKLPSLSPDVLDGENEKLKQRVWHFYVGLLLASTFAPAHKPVMLTGSRRDGEVDVRQQQDLDCPIPSLVWGYPPILAKDIQLAAELDIHKVRISIGVAARWTISSNRAGIGSFQDKIDLLTAKARNVCSRTRTVVVRSRTSRSRSLRLARSRPWSIRASAAARESSAFPSKIVSRHTVFSIQNSLSLAHPIGSSRGSPRELGSPNNFSCQRQKSRTRDIR
jgi:hypothetical protein